MSTKYEYKEVVEKRKVGVETKCDVCKKVVKGDIPDDWDSVTTNHNSWYESLEDIDICSPECYFKAMRIFIETHKDLVEATFNDLEYDFVERIVKHLKNRTNDE